jgi:hypothetical protein
VSLVLARDDVPPFVVASPCRAVDSARLPPRSARVKRRRRHLPARLAQPRGPALPRPLVRLRACLCGRAGGCPARVGWSADGRRRRHQLSGRRGQLSQRRRSGRRHKLYADGDAAGRGGRSGCGGLHERRGPPFPRRMGPLPPRTQRRRRERPACAAVEPLSAVLVHPEDGGGAAGGWRRGRCRGRHDRHPAHALRLDPRLHAQRPAGDGPRVLQPPGLLGLRRRGARPRQRIPCGDAQVDRR